ncbi:MAG: YhcN/YlaJ family sporulation lipoprotein, partial [Syntrophomonas sp.]
MMRRKSLVWFCLCLFLLVFLNGCQSNAAKKPVTPTPAKKTVENGMTPSERRVLASKLSKMAEGVNGVKKAAVVVADVGVSNSAGTNTQNKNVPFMNTKQGSGLIVMVGLTMDQTIMKDSTKVKNTKNMVMSKIKASDKRISQVLVTTDPNLIKRINDVAVGI